jgi:hypothetical protein
MAPGVGAQPPAIAPITPISPQPAPPRVAPIRCVAGTSTAQPEISLLTIDSSPPPPPRQFVPTFNIEYPHAEAELLVFPRAEGEQLQAQSVKWQDFFTDIGVVWFRFSPELPLYRVRFPATTVLQQKAEILNSSSLVRSVRANGCVFPAQIWSNDPDYGKQWALTRIRIEQAWAIEPGRHEIVVAVIDSAFEHRNQDLDGRAWRNVCENAVPNDLDEPCPQEASGGLADDIHGWNFYDANDELKDNMDHGTMVAGIIGAEVDNAFAIAGINRDVQLMDLKIYNTGAGYAGFALEAFRYAIDHGAHVINASWIFLGLFPELEAEIERASKKGILVVAAAGELPGGSGSDLDNSPVYPCAVVEPNLVCVTSTINDPTDAIEPGSHFGKQTVHLGAPGQGIRSTLDLDTGTESGTSLATPHVSGVAALIRAHCPNASVEWLAAQVQKGVSAAALQPYTRTGMRLDAANAVPSTCPTSLAQLPVIIEARVRDTWAFLVDWLRHFLVRWWRIPPPPPPLTDMPAPT